MIESQANSHVKHIRSLAADRKDRRRERLFVWRVCAWSPMRWPAARCWTGAVCAGAAGADRGRAGAA